MNKKQGKMMENIKNKTLDKQQKDKKKG